MNHPVHWPTIEDPVEAWCVFCAERGLEPQRSYCGECRPAYLEYQERLNRRPVRRLAHAFFGPSPEPSPRFTPPVTPGRQK